MRISRRGRPDRRKGELLPHSGLELPAGSGEPLAELLAAASAPPRPSELAGEEAALAAFRAARQPTAQPSAASTRRRRRIGAGAGVWAAVVAATATAGAALAAGGQLGTSPGPAPAPLPAPTTSADVPSTRSTPPAVPSRGAAPSVPSEPATNAAAPDQPGSAKLGLCRSYLAKGGVERGKSLETPAFSALVEAAGGRDGVPAYCERMLAPETGSGDGQPTPPYADGDPPGRDPSKSPGGGPKKTPGKS